MEQDASLDNLSTCPKHAFTRLSKTFEIGFPTGGDIAIFLDKGTTGQAGMGQSLFFCQNPGGTRYGTGCRTGRDRTGRDNIIFFPIIFSYRTSFHVIELLFLF